MSLARETAKLDGLRPGDRTDGVDALHAGTRAS
jgi:hypothetical protein